MSIQFRCTNPSCGRSMKAPDGSGGRQAKCPLCGTLQIIPEGQGEAEVEAPCKEITCPECGRILAGDASLCLDCGWVNTAAFGQMPQAPPAPPKPKDNAPVEEKGPSSLIIECLKAITYGTTNFRSIFALVLSSVGVAMMLDFLQNAANLFLMFGGWVGKLIGLGIILALGLSMGGYWLRFGLDSIISSLEGSDQAPDIPEFNISELFSTGLRGLGIYAIYVFPIITIPLLPLGLLGLGYANNGRAFNLLWALRAAAKRPGQLLILWAALIFWGIIATIVGWSLMIGLISVTAAVAASGWFLALLVFGAGMLFVMSVAWMFACIMFRAIGMLGRINPVLMEMMPERHNIIASITYISAGIAVSLAVWKLISMI